MVRSHGEEGARGSAATVGAVEIDTGKKVKSAIFDKTTGPVLATGPTAGVVVGGGAVITPMEVVLAGATHQGATACLVVGGNGIKEMGGSGEGRGGLKQQHVIAGQLTEGMGDDSFGAGGVVSEFCRTIKQLCGGGVLAHRSTDGLIIGGNDQPQTGINGGGGTPGKQRPIKEGANIFPRDTAGATTEG